MDDGKLPGEPSSILKTAASSISVRPT